jgi:mRNA interferase MazF
MKSKSIYKRFELWLVELEPAIGFEMKKTRPCVIISNDTMNAFLHTVIIIPLTSTQKNYPTRTDSFFNGRPGQIALDQIRVVDKNRLKKKVGTIDAAKGKDVLKLLQIMFQY